MLHALTEAEREPTLGEETDALALAPTDLGETANLRQDRTGVPGVIFISTRMGRRGPRVKWYEARPDRDASSFSVSIAEPPAVVATSVTPRLLREHEALVRDWVALNARALTEFWTDGAGLFEDERDALLARLRPLP